MIDWLTHINLIFKISRLQVVQQSGLVQEHELTCWGRDWSLDIPVISPFNSVNPSSIILQLHLICSTLNWMAVEYMLDPLSLCTHRSTSRQTDNKEGVVAHTAVVVHNLIVGGVAHPLTVIIVVLGSIAGREYVVHRTDPFRFVGLQRLHLKLIGAANLRYSALYVALPVVTHPHRLIVHDSSAREEDRTRGALGLE